MSDGPDPLGKRALYWMPVEAEAEVDEADAIPTHRVETGQAPGARAPHARPAGRLALYSDATPADEPERYRATVTAHDPLPPKGILAVACSTCGSVSRVGAIEFLVLQFPFGAWLPRRTFDRWMTCPSCRRRTWTSVTLCR
jgi:hypothetical protein